MHIDISSLSYSIVSLLVVMLSWFVDNEKVMNAMRNNILIEEEDVETRPECVPMKCLDENVCMS